jgi:hypothetical protein
MNRRTLGTLSIVALFVIAVAVWMGYARSPGGAEQTKLYPALKSNLAAVTGVTVYKAGDQLSTELAKVGNAWKVKQRHDYPADAGKVSALLIALESAVLLEQKTSSPERYGALSVQDVSDAETSGVRIELAGVKTPVSLIVKRDAGTRSTFVRRAGEKESWSVGSEIEVAAEPSQWLKKDLLNVGADRIQEASVQLSSSPAYSAHKNARADTNFDVTGIPKARELNSVTVANAFAQALSSLQLDDVRPASEVIGDKSSGRVEFRTFDGLVIECVSYGTSEQHWMTVKASFSTDQAKKFHLVTASSSADSSASSVAPNREGSLETVSKSVEAEVAAINEASTGWAYSLPTYKYDSIFKPLEDLLKKTDLLKRK